MPYARAIARVSQRKSAGMSVPSTSQMTKPALLWFIEASSHAYGQLTLSSIAGFAAGPRRPHTGRCHGGHRPNGGPT